MTGFPENFLVDPQGHIALIRRGPVDERYLKQSPAADPPRRRRSGSS